MMWICLNLLTRRRHMNILIMNPKGGAGKTTTSTIVASYLNDVKLLEIDKINKSANRIKCEHYESFQIDFNSSSDEKFLEFENTLLDEGIKVIDVGAIKLEIFFNAMQEANLFDTIDLVIIPAMDGKDDFNVAVKFLEALKDTVVSDKFMFAFSRFNNHEYATIKEQFDIFFDNTAAIKKKYSIDLKDESTYFAIQDSRAIKRANRLGVTLKSLADRDIEEATKMQRAEKDKEKRLELTRERSVINSAQKFELDFIMPMMEKIMKKLGVENE